MGRGSRSGSGSGGGSVGSRGSATLKGRQAWGASCFRNTEMPSDSPAYQFDPRTVVPIARPDQARLLPLCADAPRYLWVGRRQQAAAVDQHWLEPMGP